MLKLRSVRQEHKLSQVEVAQKLNMSPARYNNYEVNKAEPDIETLCKLADFYNTSIDYLVGRESSLINVAILTKTQQEIIKRVQNMSDKEQEYTLLYLKMRSNEL